MLQLVEHEDYVEVAEIQIALTHQGRGIGTELINNVIAGARTKHQQVRLATGLENKRAAKLYRKLGFQQTGISETHLHFTYLDSPP